MGVRLLFQNTKNIKEKRVFQVGDNQAQGSAGPARESLGMCVRIIFSSSIALRTRERVLLLTVPRLFTTRETVADEKPELAGRHLPGSFVEPKK